MAGLVAADAEWVRGPNSFDSIYCLLTGCNITGNLDIQGNLTVTGDYVNVTVVDYNVTGSMTVDGGVVADNFSGVLFWTDLSAYPSACSAGQFVSAVADTLTCSAPPDNDTNTHVIGNPPYLSNDSTTMYFNETKLNETIDAREVDTNTHVAGVAPWLFNDSTTMTFNETHFNDSVPGLNYWTQSGTNLSYVSGNVTIGGASSDGILGLVSADTETISSIDNTGALGDSVIKFQLGGTTLLTLGIRDAGTNDPFEFNYADGLDSSPELTITTDDILIGTPTVGAASLILNNKLENTCPFIGHVNVDDTNYLVLPVATCTYEDFSNGIEGQLLIIICPRPTAVTITVADTNREIGLSGGNDFVCSNAGDTLTLFMGPTPYNEWFELSRSFNS